MTTAARGPGIIVRERTEDRKTGQIILGSLAVLALVLGFLMVTFVDWNSAVGTVATRSDPRPGAQARHQFVRAYVTSRLRRFAAPQRLAGSFEIWVGVLRSESWCCWWAVLSSILSIEVQARNRKRNGAREMPRVRTPYPKP